MALNSACRDCGTGLGPEDNDGPITQPERCTRCRLRHEAKQHPLAVKGRREKALAMVVVIDANFIRQFPKLDPYDQGARIRLASFGWTDTQWEDIGENAVKPDGTHYERKDISPETRALVREIYDGRAKAPAQRRAS